MIQQITIEGFRSYQYAEFDLHPGMNVLVGESNAGKSNLLRALTWLATNTPSGDEYFSRVVPGRCIVTVETDHGIVTRERTKKFNGYRVRLGKKSYDFKDARSIPEEATKVLFLRDVNIQGEYGSVFLLNESPGNVSRYLSDILGFDQLDTAIGRAKTTASAARARLEEAERDLDGMQRRAKRLAFVDDLSARIDALERTRSEIEQKRSERRELRTEADAVAESHRKMTAARVVLEVLGPYDDIAVQLDDLSRTVGDRRALVRAADDVAAARRSMNVARTVVDATSELDTVEAKVEELASLRKQFVAVREAVDDVERRESEIADLRATAEAAARDLKLAHRAYVSALLELSKCPTCGSAITAEQAERVAAAV